MSLLTQTILDAQADKVIHEEEGQFSDVKAKEISPAKLTRLISAFANTDGGDVYIGIREESDKTRSWDGFQNQEAANGHLQPFEQLFPLGTDFLYEFLRCDSKPGLVLHVQVNKTRTIRNASDSKPYVRRGAQSLAVETREGIKQLEYNKGIASFENESINSDKSAITESDVIKNFIREVVPTVEPEAWLKKQILIREEKPTVAGVLLFSEEPQALIPKHCGIKIYRYKTTELEGLREALAFTPITIEGCLYDQIKAAVLQTAEIIGSIPKMGDASLEAITYPTDTLHEIITNAVLHRDYSVADDVHIRIFDNRVEIQSPGTLPAHITTENILEERFARNGAVVRILNKFVDPPNKDVGEGLNTAFAAMHKLGLKEPIIAEKDNSVLVIIKHEPLASPEQAILTYLDTHPTIKNADAREVTHVRADYQIKSIFGRMVKSGLIEQVPHTRTNSTAYRKPQK